MSEKERQQKLERLQSQIWGHLERGNWHSAAMLAEYMSETDTLSNVTGLAESTRAVALIAEAVLFSKSIDQNVLVRLDEISLTWPRLYGMRSFQTLLQTVEEAVAKNQNAPTVQSAVLTEIPSQHVEPSAWKSIRGLLRHIAKPKG